jgi:hypothetical protein
LKPTKRAVAYSHPEIGKKRNTYSAMIKNPINT